MINTMAFLSIYRHIHIYSVMVIEPSPSIGKTDIVFGNHEFSLDVYGQNNTMSYYKVVCHDERARYADQGHHNGRGEQEDSPRPSKTTEKSKSKTTFLDIMMEENITSNKKLTKKDYNRPDVIHAKQTELEFFF